MSRNMRAHMSMPTLRAVSGEGGRTGVGMKDKNTLTVHCTTCHSRDTEDGEEKCSMNWHTGTQGKTEPA